MHAKLQAGTMLRGPTEKEIDEGMISVDEDEPRALKERSVFSPSSNLDVIGQLTREC